MIPGSLVYSPPFVRSLLSMAKLGAGPTEGGGGTGPEISTALGIPLPNEELEGFSQNLEDVLSYFKGFSSAESDSQFLESRSLWIKKGFEISVGFQESFPSCFPSASFHQIEFSNPTMAASQINSWFSKETDNQVRNVVQPGELTSFTRILLLDGVYFRGNWALPFPVKNTRKSSFRLSAKKSLEVDMMNRAGKFLYAEFPSLEAQAVAIPYHGGDFHLLIILPTNNGISLDKLRIRGLPPHPILKGMKPRSINLKLPRFSMESRLHFIPLLKHIGVKSMFDPSVADFSGITGGHVQGGTAGLFVSDVIQAVRMEVNEGKPAPPPPSAKPSRRGISGGIRSNGTKEDKDGGTTTPGGTGGFALTVDHPFIFQLIHKPTNTLLIDGTCMDPSIPQFN